MNEALTSEVGFGSLVNAAGVLVGQWLVGVNGIDPVQEALQIIVPLAMLFHEGIGFAAAGGARGENQNVALGPVFFGSLSLIEGLDHELIVNGRASFEL